jgi:pimeloyl-ACP methyl ester carboxylesterase
MLNGLRPMLVNNLSTIVGVGDARRKIAVRVRAGGSPGLVWLPGFMADMQGAKATALQRWAAEHERATLYFDYSGHGQSSGHLREGTISRWLEESTAVFDAHCKGPQVVIGSSMGGWLALLLARELSRRPSPPPAWLAGMVLIAPAVDFTEELVWKRFTNEAKRRIEATGEWEGLSSNSNQRYLITRNLIEDGRRHLLLGASIETGCAVRILHGLKDRDVPWACTAELLFKLTHHDVVLSLIKDAEHSLSRPCDVDRLINAVDEF